MVIQNYEYALDLLDEYDHRALVLDRVTKMKVSKVTIDEIHKIINEMRTDFFTDLFWVERESSFLNSIENVYQIAFGEEEQYYVKNHHEAIVSRELFDDVQVIMKKLGGRRV